MSSPRDQPVPGTRRRVVVLVVELVVVAFVVRYLWQRREELGQLAQLDPGYSVTLVALMGVTALVRAQELGVVLRCLGAHLSFAESFSLTQATSLLNYAPFSPGIVFRAHVLNRYRSLSYAHYVSLMSALALVTWVAGGVMGLLVIAVDPAATGDARPWVVGLLVLAPVLSFAAFFVPPGTPGEGGWLRRQVTGLLLGWQEIRRSPRALVQLLVLAGARLVVIGVRFWVCFYLAGLNASLADGVMFSVITSLLLVVNITPGSLGIRELLVAGLGSITGLSFPQAMLAASLDRVVMLGVTGVLGGAGLIHVRARLR